MDVDNSAENEPMLEVYVSLSLKEITSAAIEQVLHVLGRPDEIISPYNKMGEPSTQNPKNRDELMSQEEPANKSQTLSLLEHIDTELPGEFEYPSSYDEAAHIKMLIDQDIKPQYSLETEILIYEFQSVLIDVISKDAKLNRIIQMQTEN